MKSLFRACSSALLSSCQQILPTYSLTKPITPFNSIKFDLKLTVRCYSSVNKKTRAVKTRGMEDKNKEKEEGNNKDEFFVVRKGDLVGVYRSLSDCQAQVGSSICDPPVSVYKGHSMPKNTKEYLLSCGLEDALYSIRAADLKDDLFGTLVPCPFQLPFPKQSEMDVSKKRLFEAMGAETMVFLSLTLKKMMIFFIGQWFDRLDGMLKLREGLGTTTNNVAEYRAMILGLRYALDKGFEKIRVFGDSKLVCMQTQGLWKVKDQNMSNLHKEAKILEDKFLSFEIKHVLRGSNAEADAQANLGATLAGETLLRWPNTERFYIGLEKVDK